MEKNREGRNEGGKEEDKKRKSWGNRGWDFSSMDDTGAEYTRVSKVPDSTTLKTRDLLATTTELCNVPVKVADRVCGWDMMEYGKLVMRADTGGGTGVEISYA